MPLFEYFCHTCHSKFEKLLSEPTEDAACPDCGKEAKRIVSMFASGATCTGPAASGFG